MTYRHDATKLYEHVVDGSGNSPGADAVRGCGSPRHLYWVDIWVSGDQSHHRKPYPIRGRLGERVKGNEQGKCPDLKTQRCDNSAVDDLAHVAEDEQVDHAKDSGRNGEQTRLRRGETHIAQGQREVILRRSDWNCDARSSRRYKTMGLNDLLRNVNPRMYIGQSRQSAIAETTLLSDRP